MLKKKKTISQPNTNYKTTTTLHVLSPASFLSLSLSLSPSLPPPAPNLYFNP